MEICVNANNQSSPQAKIAPVLNVVFSIGKATFAEYHTYMIPYKGLNSDQRDLQHEISSENVAYLLQLNHG